MSKPLANQSAVAGAPGVLIVRDKDGKEHTFLVSKPSARDHITMHKWLMSQPIPGDVTPQGINSAELVGLKPEEKRILLREYAKVKTQRREPTESEALQIASSTAGVVMQVWLAVRRHDRSINRE